MSKREDLLMSTCNFPDSGIIGHTIERLQHGAPGVVDARSRDRGRSVRTT